MNEKRIELKDKVIKSLSYAIIHLAENERIFSCQAWIEEALKNLQRLKKEVKR